mgnify:CR=1 FL=1
MPAVGRAGPALRLATLNASGLAHRSRLEDTLRWARDSDYHIVVVQETHLDGDPFGTLDARGAAPAPRLLWRGAHFWCPGSRHTRGSLV